MEMMKSIYVWAALGLPAAALIFRDGASPAANTETAPIGTYVDSGWKHQIRYQSYHGTMISPKHFITATHLGAAETVVTQPLHFNEVGARTWAIKPESRVVIGTTDLAVFEIWETFDDYAELYTGSNEVGKEMVIHGRGFGRGAEFAGKGWEWGEPVTRKSRWGRNVLDGVTVYEGDDLLFFTFDDVMGQDEAMATGGDSGGGWFVKDGPVWKLAAVSFTVDLFYSEAAEPTNANSLKGAFYEAGGLSFGSDAEGWNLLPTTGFSVNPDDGEFYRKSHTYGSRISDSLAEIELLIDPAIAWAGLTSAEKFESWLSGYGVTGASGGDDDADGDGLTNLEEYLTESDPDNGGEALAPLAIEFLPGGTHQFTLLESLNLAARGLTTVLQSSSDLSTWTAVSDAGEVSNERNDPAGIRTRVLARTSVGADELYYRLKISL